MATLLLDSPNPQELTVLSQKYCIKENNQPIYYSRIRKLLQLPF